MEAKKELTTICANCGAEEVWQDRDEFEEHAEPFCGVCHEKTMTEKPISEADREKLEKAHDHLESFFSLLYALSEESKARIAFYCHDDGYQIQKVQNEIWRMIQK